MGFALFQFLPFQLLLLLPLPSLSSGCSNDRRFAQMCSTWSRYCSSASWGPWMEVYCPETCAACSPCECQDHPAYISKCDGWKSHCSRGKWKDFVNARCPATCNACQCCEERRNLSGDENCAAWESTGYCSSSQYGAWMWVNCYKSCSRQQCGDRYSFLGGLSYSWDSSNSPFCAGTLVSARWVITSASCSYADSSVVSPDTVNVMMGSTAVSVDRVIVHSGYSQSGEENNIALWRLAQASKESPLCLPAQGSQQSGTAKLVGWRINPLSGYLNEELGEKEVALIEDCGQSGRICSTSTTTQCGGDYGGPLVQGSDTLIGAAVSDSGCGGTGGGKGLFTQISEHTDWIKRMISDNGGGDTCTNR